jgi:hypothetical protein
MEDANRLTCAFRQILPTPDDELLRSIALPWPLTY